MVPSTVNEGRCFDVEPDRDTGDHPDRAADRDRAQTPRPRDEQDHHGDEDGNRVGNDLEPIRRVRLEDVDEDPKPEAHGPRDKELDDRAIRHSSSARAR